jgi:hypothetical protein
MVACGFKAHACNAPIFATGQSLHTVTVKPAAASNLQKNTSIFQKGLVPFTFFCPWLWSFGRGRDGPSTLHKRKRPRGCRLKHRKNKHKKDGIAEGVSTCQSYRTRRNLERDHSTGMTEAWDIASIWSTRRLELLSVKTGARHRHARRSTRKNERGSLSANGDLQFASSTSSQGSHVPASQLGMLPSGSTLHRPCRLACLSSTNCEMVAAHTAHTHKRGISNTRHENFPWNLSLHPPRTEHSCCLLFQ